MISKPTRLLVLAVSLLFPLGAQAQNFNDIEPGKDTYSANKTVNPIVIDGDLSEWTGAEILADPRFYIPKFSGSDVNVDGELVNFEILGNGDWTGPDDHTSAVRVLYDDDNVYFGFVVTDEYHENAANSAWNGDSVQLMVADGARAAQVALYNYALGGVEGDLADETIVNHEARPEGGEDTEAIVLRNSETKRTIYEIKLPKSAMGLESLTQGVQFGLGMAINDGDEATPGQKGWGGLGAHSIVFGKTPSETALVTLAAPTVERERVQGNDIEPGKEFYTAIKAAEPIVLDGDLSEWRAAQLLADPRFSIPKGSKADGELVNFEILGDGDWTGADDHTSAVRVVYDDDNVYFGFVVTDEYHENAANSAWNGDSVQLMVANDARDAQVALYNYALGGVEGDIGEIIVNHEARPDGGDDTEAIVLRDEENKRTTYEIKLPKSALAIEELKGGVQFGLGMAINDGDESTPGQKGWGGLGAHSIVFGKTPGETALVTLGTANDIEPGKEYYSADLPPGEINVDGELNDWGGVPVLADPRFAIPKGTTSRADNADLVLFEILGDGDWTGPDDHTSTVQIAYDPDNVYFAFVVTDEYHENAANSAWNGDSIQLMIANEDQDTQVALYNYALGGTETELGEIIVNHEARPEGGADTEAIVTRNVETKRTTYEIKLPKSAMGLDELGPGTQFGLGMAINDGDEATPGQKGWGGLGAHSIVFGKTPSETALVTLGVIGTGDDPCFASSITTPKDNTPGVFSFRGNDFEDCVHDTAVLRIDGQEVELVATDAGLGATDYTHTFPSPFAGGTKHTFTVELLDANGKVVFTETGPWTAPTFKIFKPEERVRRVDDTKPGFLWRVFQNSTYSSKSLTETELALAGELIDPITGDAITDNLADPGQVGAAEAAGESVGDLFEFEISGVINLHASADGEIGGGNFVPDEQMPGLPGDEEDGGDGRAGARIEILTYVDLPAGRTTLGVHGQGSNGFRMEGGPFDNNEVMGEFVPNQQQWERFFKCDVSEAGVYPVRVVYFNNGGGGSIEIFSVNDAGEKILLNDIANGGLATYRSAPEEFNITEISRDGGNVSLSFQSKVGGYYAVDTSTDLVNWEAIVTQIPDGGATTESTSYTDSGVPADTTELYYRVRQVAPPAIYFTDFEGENGAEGWTVETDSGSTEWELGTPAVDGLMAAASGTQAWGTDLDGNYTSEFNLTRLRSPVINASVKTAPKLSFNYFIDSTIDVEGGQLRFLDESGEPLWVQEGEDILSGQVGGWTPFSIRFPSDARGVPVIIEFAFLTDDDGDVGAGWYIDDVKVD
ncbi:hypothetical protein OAV21_00520 [bacterium]|nr:hypothetical protein [Verrucomicrobiales bacterium]MDC0503729.1 hypothetical protein [Verrucomicrobiales bacterium]MDC3254865.1 hypothetical protein [bacterium]